jgi:hypothetical protein
LFETRFDARVVVQGLAEHLQRVAERTMAGALS